MALGLAVLPAGVQAENDGLPGWMAGCWEMHDAGRWADECWTVPRGGMMIGSGRAGTGDSLASFEHMRIERGEGGALTFLASPGGKGWTAFAPAADPGEGITFVNPANDYPQRVRYWRDGELLMAEISLADGGRAMRWTFARTAR
jgi:hypothetical protein